MSTTARAPRRSLSKRLFSDSSIAAKIGLCLALLVLVAAGLTGLSVQRMDSLNRGSEQALRPDEPADAADHHDRAGVRR